MGQILREHKGFGRQIFLLSKNELIKTYKASLLGPIWAIIKPLLTLLVYMAAIKFMGTSPKIAGYPRFLFILPAFVPWFFMSESITGGTRSIRVNSQFVTKITFPVSTIMTFTGLSRLYTHLLLCVIMYAYLLIKGPGPSIYNLQFFLYCPLMLMFFICLSWITAPLAAFSRDFENLINSIMTGIFWLSGIMWNSYGLDIRWLRDLMLANPVNFFANGYRKAFLFHEWFFQQPKELIVFMVEFIVVVALGAWNYQRLRKRLPDIL